MDTILAKIKAGAESTATRNSQPTSTPTPPNPPADECPDCHGAGYLRLDVPPGHPQFGKPVPCNNPRHDGQRMKRIAKLSGLHEADLSRRLGDIIPNDDNLEMLDAARQIISDPFGEAPNWLYIWGGPGNAKTEVLIAIINELKQQGHGPVLYTKFSTVIDYMRDAFNEQKQRALSVDGWGGTYIERFERLKKIKVLAIDEMDKARSTPFVDEFRFDFLDDRYRQGIHNQTITLFAGNTDPAEFDAAIWDRIRDGHFSVVHNKAGSARPYMRR